METFLGGLGLAAITGLTYIAYRHPKGYRTLFWPLAGVCGAVTIFLVGYQFGGIQSVDHELTSRLSRMPGDSLSTVAFSINGLHDSLTVIQRSLLVGVAVLAYLLFLYQLPRILNLKGARQSRGLNVPNNNRSLRGHIQAHQVFVVIAHPISHPLMPAKSYFEKWSSRHASLLGGMGHAIAQ